MGRRDPWVGGWRRWCWGCNSSSTHPKNNQSSTPLKVTPPREIRGVGGLGGLYAHILAAASLKIGSCNRYMRLASLSMKILYIIPPTLSKTSNPNSFFTNPHPVPATAKFTPPFPPGATFPWTCSCAAWPPVPPLESVAAYRWVRTQEVTRKSPVGESSR
jgi:hypothetical protein